MASKFRLRLDALITQGGIALPMHLAAARAVYGPHFAPIPTLKALTYFGDGDLPSLPDEIKRRLARAATAVDPLQLPSLDLTSRPDPEPKQDQ